MGLQENFISNLKRLRKERGLTQEKLAEFCETDTCYIGQIETFRRFPSLSLIEKIADALQVEPHTLFFPEEKSDKQKTADFSKTEIKTELRKIELEIKKLIERIVQ